jgi:hypothetical protein
MAIQTQAQRDDSEVLEAKWEPESPFLTSYLPATETNTDRETTEQERSALTYFTPFVSEYMISDSESMVDPKMEAINEFQSDIYDREFNEAMEALVEEARDIYHESIVGSGEMNEVQGSITERMIQEHFNPLIHAAEQLFERAAEESSRQNINPLNEFEVNSFLESLEPQQTELQPAFEYFLKKLWNKAKNVVKTAANIAKKGLDLASKFMPINVILSKLKSLVKPLLQRVLKFGLSKIPPTFRPLAENIAKKFGLSISTEMNEAEEENQPSVYGETETIQNEFDQAISEIMFTSNEAQQDIAIAQYNTAVQDTGLSPSSQLNQSRAQFVKDISNLKQGENPAPALENFIPAILTALRLGIKIIGRPKVVKFLAGLLSKLIEKFIGKEQAMSLSNILVDAGLRLINAEVTYQNEMETAFNTIAETIEDTVRRVTELPEAVFENETLMESFVSEAFEQAAAANFPGSIIKPKLREDKDNNGAWVLMTKPLYKKYTRIVNITLNSGIANAIKTFQGITLSQFLRDSYGMDITTPIEAKVHLYESLSGTWLNNINKAERNIPGLGIRNGHSQIHPLTREAAGLLLKQPDLGRDVAPMFLSNRNRIKIGQRFYYLEIPGARLRINPVDIKSVPQSTQTFLRIDLRGEIKLCLFLSESDAQNINKMLKDRSIPSVIKTLRTFIQDGLDSVKKMSRDRVIIRPQLKQLPQDSNFPLASTLLSSLLGWVNKKINDWIWGSILKYFESKSQEFSQAVEDPKFGVTISINFRGISWPNGLVNALKSAGIPYALRAMAKTGIAPAMIIIPETTIKTIPGMIHA